MNNCVVEEGILLLDNKKRSWDVVVPADSRLVGLKGGTTENPLEKDVRHPITDNTK
jgi:hypothetical protein